MPGYRWKPIEDLPQDWTELVSFELQSLAEVWKTQAVKLRESEAVRQFNERLSREWAIETGIIENLYAIDRGTTQLLIEKGIDSSLMPYGTTDKPAEKIVPLLRDQQMALEGLFAFVKQDRELSTFYVRQLHEVLTRHQETVLALTQFGQLMEVELLRGEWKKHPNNPTRLDGAVHQYTPPEQVASEMDHLVEMYSMHKTKGVTPEVEAAWLHHRFTQVHPFQDGNGRVARALASLVFLQAGWFPLVVTRDDRSAYLDALEKADDGDLKELIQLFAKIEKKAFLRALSLSDNVIKEFSSLQEVIVAIGERLKANKLSKVEQEYSAVFALSRYLETIGEERLKVVAEGLNQQFTAFDQNYVSAVSHNSSKDQSRYLEGVTKALSSDLGYEANTDVYLSTLELSVKNNYKDEVNLVVSFHALGEEFVGVMAVSAFLVKSLGPDTGGNTTNFLSKEAFQFSNKDDKQKLVQRFEDWLGTVIIEGLSQWRRQLP